MVLGMRTAKRYDIMFKDGFPVLIDVTDLGEGYGYVSAVEMREAIKIGARMSHVSVEVSLKRFDSMLKRLLTGKLTSEDVVHHSKVRY